MGLGISCAPCSLIYAQTSPTAKRDPQQLFQAAYEAQQRGDTALAASKYEELLKIYPDMTAARANLGIVLVSLGRFDEAIEQDRRALNQFPDNAALRLNLALAYFKKGDFASAASQLKTLNEAQPNDVKVAILLGQSCVRLARDEEAITLLSPLEPAHSDNLDLEWALGSALTRVGRTQEGLERIEKVAEQGHSAEAYMVAAQSRLKLGDFEPARRDYDEALRLDPNLPGLATVGGMVMDYSGDHKGAAAAYQKALKANPNDFEAHLRLGSSLYEDRQLDAAKEHLRRALDLVPTSYIARYELARVERAQGLNEAAAKDLEEIVRGQPDWLPAHIELASLYYRLKRPEDGARERKIVDRLTEAERKNGTKSRVISPPTPSQ